MASFTGTGGMARRSAALVEKFNELIDDVMTLVDISDPKDLALSIKKGVEELILDNRQLRQRCANLESKVGNMRGVLNGTKNRTKNWY